MRIKSWENTRSISDFMHFWWCA